MLQFITHCRGRHNEISGTRAVLEGGCRWVQLRMKGASESELLPVGRTVGELCRSFEAVFIIDDRVDLVEALGADGVHLGKNDMPVAEARKILGESKIIGATANTVADMLAAAEAGADYIGLGPFRFTTTKERLSPVLGIGGYREAMDAFRQKSDLPVVAIGGITAADITALMATGGSGVAPSGTLLRGGGPTAGKSEILNLCNTKKLTNS